MRTKTQGPELKAETDFKGQCSDLEGYIFNIGMISSDKFASTMKELERYLRATYNNRWHPAIITETPETPPNPDMPTIIPDTVVERPKTYTEMTYLKKKNIDEAICQKLMKKDVYETGMHKIYNILVGQIN